MQQSVIFVNKKLKIKIWKIKNIVQPEIIVIIQGNIDLLGNIVLPEKIPIGFHKGLNYDYRFIIKQQKNLNILLQEKALKIPLKKEVHELIKMQKKLVLQGAGDANSRAAPDPK